MLRLACGRLRVVAARWPCARGARHLTGFSALASRSLDSILKLDTVTHSSPEEVASLWNGVMLSNFKELVHHARLSLTVLDKIYHSGRSLISAVIKKELFNTLQHRAKTCPLFVVPLRQGNGYTTFFLQAQMPHLLFTGLEDYKVRGTNASPYLTVAHYTELADSKGLVLVRGDVVFPSKLSDVEAKQLMEVSHSFFLDDSRYRLVEQFNKESGNFEFKEVLQELNLPVGA